MAFLLLLHEKMRLKRKVNTMTLRQAKLANRKSRIANNITRIQKMFSKQTAMLEKQSSIWTKQFSMMMSNSMGLGAQNQAFNPMYGGVSSFVIGGIQQMLASGKIPKGSKESDGYFAALGESRIQELLTEYNSGTLRAYVSSDGKAENGKYGSKGQFTEDEYKAFSLAMSQAQQTQSQAQFYCQQMSSQYETNVSIWLEAQKQALEEQQEEMLLPLEVEQEEIEMETEGLEVQLQDARARLEALNQACSQEVKDSVPKFGLG